MKKALVVFLLLLACCTPAPVSIVTPTPAATHTPIARHVFREEDRPSIKAFKTGARCPTICWLGIHPGATTVSATVGLLRSSTAITEMQISDNRILAIWLPGTSVSIEFSSGIVKSISLDEISSLSVSDFMSFMGEPDELKINTNCYDYLTGGSHCTEYTLYYSALSTAAEIDKGNGDGPAANNLINRITVNIPVEESQRQYMQPWLGYGYLPQYLSLRPAPTPTP